tara:strand:- start:100 stop:1062 length:963 start_codon:yes stop_codon:yes gene_type:complete
MAGIEDYNKKSFLDNMKNYINGLEQKNNENALQKETVGREDYNDGNLDDYSKLLANSLSGGIYDLGRFMYEGNPLSFMTGEDLPGIGEFAFGATPFEDGGGTFFDYDQGFKPFNKDPEFIEKIGRGAASFATPFGLLGVASKVPKAFDMASKVFPSMKYFNDLGKMNRLNRNYKQMNKGKQPSENFLTKAYDNFIKPVSQTFYRPLFAPFKRSTKINKDFIKNPKKNLFTNKPEYDYYKSAARNWAIAGGVRSGIEGAKYVNENKKLPPFLSSANAAQPSYNNSPGHPGNRNYRSMQPKPNITVEFDNGYVDETGTIQPR